MANKRKLLFKIEFDGRPFCGWQKQSDEHESVHLPSIQGSFEKILSEHFHENIKVTGCGRTDAGVHAEVYGLHFELSSEALKNYDQLDNIRGAINSKLPQEIRVKKVFEVEADFHALRSLKDKTYEYRVFLGEVTPVLIHDRCYYYKTSEFSLDRLAKCLKLFEGEKDFAAFASSGYSVATTVRTLYSAQYSLEDYPQLSPQGQLLKIRLNGNGFLKQMVRNLVGTALMVASSKKDFEYVEKLFHEGASFQKNTDAYLCVPAHALFLVQLNYYDRGVI